MAQDVGMVTDLQSIGDEWASREHTMEVIREFIWPYIDSYSVVGEVGVGGGKVYNNNRT